MKQPPIAVYGLGRWGTSLALGLLDHGLPLAGVGSRHRRTDLPDALRSLWVDDPCELVRRAEWIFLTVRDDALATVAERFADLPVDWHARVVLHSSGLHPPERLAPLADRGARVGVLHPLNTFPDPVTGRTRIAGTAYTIVADPPVQQALVAFVHSIGGIPHVLPRDFQPIYHLIAVLVANAPVVCAAWGRALLRQSGLERYIPWEAYRPLIEAAAQGMVDPEPIRRLTGPWVRNDRSTMRVHRQWLRRMRAPEERVYRELARIARYLVEQYETHPPTGGTSPTESDT